MDPTNLPGLRTALHIDGTLNDNSDRNRGWTVVLAFPWHGMEWLNRGDDRLFAVDGRGGDLLQGGKGFDRCHGDRGDVFHESCDEIHISE